MLAYQDIQIAGGDTAKPLAMRKRLKFILECGCPEGARFLDCGCGAGEYVFALNKLGFNAYGIEYDAEKVRKGNQHPELGERISQGDLQTLQLPEGTWDCAMLNEVLEHVPDDLEGLRNVYRLLKPGGLVFIFSPNRWFPFETHGTFFKKSGRRIPHWVPLIPYIPLPLGEKFIRYWARNYWHGELRQLAESAGFTVVKTGYIWLTFEGISGRQPAFIRIAKPLLRQISFLLEKLPFLRKFGVSQVLVCRK